MANVKMSDLVADPDTLLSAVATGDYILIYDISEPLDAQKIKVIAVADFLNLVTETARQAIVASQAAGDIFYASGAAALARLAKGAVGTYLKMGASAPEWAVPAYGSGCSVYRATDLSAPAFSYYPIPFTDEYWDDGAYHSNTINNTRINFTASTAGRYLLTAYCIFGSGTPEGYRHVSLYKNGSIYLERLQEDKAGNYLTIAAVCELADGDYIELHAVHGYQTSNVPITPTLTVTRLK